MPSLGDIANEVKSLLNDIKTNVATIRQHTKTISQQLAQLDNDVRSGFSNLAQGMQVLIELGMQSNILAAENNEQNRTIICWLQNVANTACEIKRDADRQVALQKDLAATLHHLDDMGEVANPGPALEVAKRNEIKDKLNECCPPPEERVHPCFEPCAEHKPVKFERVKTDWKPVNYGGQVPPID